MTATFFTSTLLLTFRMLPLFVVAPVTVFKRLPVLVRILLTVTLAMTMASGLSDSTAIVISWPMLISEFLLGLILAFGFHAAIGAINAMGHVLDQQMGLAAAAVFDPNTDQSSSLVAETLTLGALASFLAIDGHHAILRGLSALANTLPPGISVMPDAHLLGVLGAQFGFAFALVAPLMIGMWLTDFALAMISRAAPQANIYFVAAPVKLAVGLLALSWLAANMLPAITRMFGSAIGSWSTSLGH